MFNPAVVLQTVGYSAMIREAFAGDKGLSGTVRRLPIERQFRLDNVKMVHIPAKPFYMCNEATLACSQRVAMDTLAQQ